MGRFIILSIALAVLWYVLVQWTVGLTLDARALAGRQLPTADAMSAVYGSAWGGRVLVYGGLMGILTSWNAFFIGASRLVFAMARGGMLPSAFARLHPRYESPVAAVALVTALSLAAPFFGRQALVWLADAGSLAAVVGYFLVAVAFLRMRRRYPDLPRPYRVLAPRLVGILALLTTLFFISLYLPWSPSSLKWPQEWMIVLGWALLGMILALWRRRGAGLLGPQEQARRILGEYAEQLR